MVQIIAIHFEQSIPGDVNASLVRCSRRRYLVWPSASGAAGMMLSFPPFQLNSNSVPGVVRNENIGKQV